MATRYSAARRAIAVILHVLDEDTLAGITVDRDEFESMSTADG